MGRGGVEGEPGVGSIQQAPALELRTLAGVFDLLGVNRTLAIRPHALRTGVGALRICSVLAGVKYRRAHSET